MAEEKVKEDRKVCGHINKQFINKEGKLEDLACVLAPKHDGDHSAPYICLRVYDGGLEDPAKTYEVHGGKKYLVAEETALWSDAAAKTIFEYEAEMSAKRDALQEFKKSNPDATGLQIKQKMKDLGLIPADAQ